MNTSWTQDSTPNRPQTECRRWFLWRLSARPAPEDAGMRSILYHIEENEMDPSYLATHRFSLEESPRGYEMFKHKEDECVRAVFTP